MQRGRAAQGQLHYFMPTAQERGPLCPPLVPGLPSFLHPRSRVGRRVHALDKPDPPSTAPAHPRLGLLLLLLALVSPVLAPTVASRRAKRRSKLSCHGFRRQQRPLVVGPAPALFTLPAGPALLATCLSPAQSYLPCLLCCDRLGTQPGVAAAPAVHTQKPLAL